MSAGEPALTGGVDVDEVARVASRCPGVRELLVGFPEVATYLPGRRVDGIRVLDRSVDIQVRAAWGTPLPEIGAGIRAAVGPLVGGRAVDVRVAALDDPASGSRAADAAERGGLSEPGTRRRADLRSEPDKVQGDPLLSDIAAGRRVGVPAERPSPRRAAEQPTAQATASRHKKRKRSTR